MSASIESYIFRSSTRLSIVSMGNVFALMADAADDSAGGHLTTACTEGSTSSTRYGHFISYYPYLRPNTESLIGVTPGIDL